MTDHFNITEGQYNQLVNKEDNESDNENWHEINVEHDQVELIRFCSQYDSSKYEIEYI